MGMHTQPTWSWLLLGEKQPFLQQTLCSAGQCFPDRAQLAGSGQVCPGQGLSPGSGRGNLQGWRQQAAWLTAESNQPPMLQGQPRTQTPGSCQQPAVTPGAAALEGAGVEGGGSCGGSQRSGQSWKPRAWPCSSFILMVWGSVSTGGHLEGVPGPTAARRAWPARSQGERAGGEGLQASFKRMGILLSEKSWGFGKMGHSWVWWCAPITPTLRRLKQKNPCEFNQGQLGLPK